MTDKELDKNATRRLAIIRHTQEVTGNVALTCRYYGISRQVFYRWLRRYEAERRSDRLQPQKSATVAPTGSPAAVSGSAPCLPGWADPRKTLHAPSSI